MARRANKVSRTAAAAALLLAAVIALAATSEAVSTQMPAQVHAPHHTSSSSSKASCGKGVPCPDEVVHQTQQHQQQQHKHAADARNAHYSGQQHNTASIQHHGHPVASHIPTASAPAHNSRTHNTASGSTGPSSSTYIIPKPAALPSVTEPAEAVAAPPAAAPANARPASCQAWGADHMVETEEDQLDRPYGIDPATGRAPDEEDAAEDAIVAAAKKAGVDTLKYEAEHDEEAHMAPSHHVAMSALSPDLAESLHHGFRLSYVLHIWFNKHSSHHGDALLLTQFSTSENHELLNAFGQALKDALYSVLPDGVAELRTLNWIPGEPLEVDLVIYPDLLIPDQINPSWVLHATEQVMNTLTAGKLSSSFVDTWVVDEIQVTPHPDNEREILDCEEVYPLHQDHNDNLHSGGQQSTGRSTFVTLLLACPVIAGVAVAAHTLFTTYQNQRQSSVLPKYPVLEQTRRKRFSSSCGGAPASNKAEIYATPLDCYTGPYRNVYSSGGGSSCSSTYRSSIPGSFQDSRSDAPQISDGGAQ